MTSVISVVADATLITLTLALAVFGLAVIYGLLGVINLGHGAMLTLGAYFFWSASASGMPFIIGIIFAGGGVAIVGLVFEHIVIRHFYDKLYETMLLTWGFFLLTSELIKIAYGTELLGVTNPLPGAMQVGGVVLPIYRTAVAAFSLLLIAITALFLYHTSIGLRIRAMVQNQEMAELLGLNTALIYKLVFTAGAFFTGISGAILSPLMSIDPYIGNIYLVRSFFVVIVGGVGQLFAGTLVGSFFIGGMETVFATFSSQTFAQTAVFATAAIIVRFRPGGLFR